ncbi:transmembrane protein 74B [Mergus octosetaceus]
MSSPGAGSGIHTSTGAIAHELLKTLKAWECAEGDGNVMDKSSRQLSAAHPLSLGIYVRTTISSPPGQRLYVCERGGGSMAAPRAAELRSPVETAATAGNGGGGGGPGGFGPAPGPGMALALGCALSGAALVVLAGAVPRAARPDPAVPARQMERLEARAARLRARLDRCTVAGLALLALGGLLLAALLLAAAAARRRARAARRAGGTYGSVRLRMRRVSAEGAQALLESQLSPPPQPPEGPGS